MSIKQTLKKIYPGIGGYSTKHPKLSEPSDFKKGIYKMNVGAKSHVKKPYYVEVVDIGIYSIITNIPGRSSLLITQQGSSPNWDYHIGRFEYVGDHATYGHLLIDQKGLI